VGRRCKGLFEMKYRFRRKILYILLLIAEKIFFVMPYDFALKLGRTGGRLVYIFLARYRNLTKHHLELAFKGSMTQGEINRTAESVFMNIGMGLIEILSLSKIKNRLDTMISIEGISNIDKALAQGNGAVVISAHFGNWELVPMYFANKGYPSNILARPIYYEKYNKWISFLRSSMGVNVVYRTESPRRLLEILKNNQLLGIVADQDIDSVDGVFIDFFKRKAYTPSAPVKLACSAKAPIIPVLIVRNGARHKIYVEEPIRVEKSSREDWVAFYTQKWSDVVESYINKYPDQWVWMHKRWKTKPLHKAS
jgi:Kdo2-lipid IVA lauroyltransferase/acyltransferase